MARGSKWVRPTQKRSKAVAYGTYPVDDEPNPLDLQRDAERVEIEADRERRQEARRVLDGIKQSSKGRARVGKWEPSE